MMKSIGESCSKFNTKYQHQKSLFLSPACSQEFDHFNIMKAKNLLLSNSWDKSSKNITLWRTPKPLKEEIKYLLKQLSKERLQSLEWKNLTLVNKSKERKCSIYVKNYGGLPSERTNNKNRMIKESDLLILSDSDSISMRHIRPNLNLDTLFN